MRGWDVEGETDDSFTSWESDDCVNETCYHSVHENLVLDVHILTATEDVSSKKQKAVYEIGEPPNNPSITVDLNA